MIERLLQHAVTGVSAGSLYALVALGVVLIYRSTRVLNFAHGDMATLGTFVAFALLERGQPAWVAFPAALAAGAGVAALFHFTALVPAQRKGATLLGQVILTVALSLVLQGLIVHEFGSEPERLPFPLSDSKAYRFGPVYISELSLGAMAAGALGCALLTLLVQRTRLGLAMRAVAENLPAAQTLGLPTRGVLAFAWAAASALGVLAGLFLAPAVLLDPYFMLDPFLKGFAAAVLGGLESLPGAVLGGVLLGLAEALAGAYVSIEFKRSLAFVIILAVLLVRPQGLLGKEFRERV